MRCVIDSEVFDSDLSELKSLRGLNFESKALETYHTGLIAYLEHDLGALKSAELALEKTATGAEISEESIALVLLHLRRQCREHSVDSATLKLAENFTEGFGAKLLPEWQGELHFVLSNAYATLSDHKKSRDEALRASQHLKVLGSKRKAVRALLNALAAESALRPKKRYIPDLQHIYGEAKLVQDWASMGTVLLNLAHEYRKLGALNAALKSAERAVALQAKHNPAKLDHHFALLNCAHILLDLRRAPEARAMLEEIEASEFAEIQSGLQVLRDAHPRLFKAKAGTKISLGLTPTWSERSRGKSLPKLSQSEENLIQVLSRKPLPLETLLDKLYGDKIDFECRKNRFYNLLNRIKKKHSGLIQSRQGVYGLKERPVFATGAKAVR